MDNNLIKVELLLGANTPDKKSNITRATIALQRFLHDVKKSPLHYAPDFTGRGADYVNRVISGNLHAAELNLFVQHLKTLEQSLGRDRSTPTVVAADLDIVTITRNGDTEITAPREFATTIFQSLRNKVR